jgi:hypothetical protein
VNTIDGMARRTSPHVGEEILVTGPPFANRDTAPAVFGKILIGWIATAFAQANPRSIFSRRLPVFQAFTMDPVCFSPLSNALKFKTTTGTRVAFTQRVRKDGNFFSTVAAAMPQRSPVFSLCHGYDSQARISMSRDINEVHGKPPLRVACEVAAGRLTVQPLRILEGN